MAARDPGIDRQRGVLLARVGGKLTTGIPTRGGIIRARSQAPAADRCLPISASNLPDQRLTGSLVVVGSPPLMKACRACGTLFASQAEDGGPFCLGCLFDAAISSQSDKTDAIPSPLAVPAPSSGTLFVDPRFAQYELAVREDGTFVELGRGGMGVTYRAMDTTLRCAVALKVVNPTFVQDARVRARFLREAQVAAGLRHPHVASVFFFGERTQDSQLFYAMELVEGETLHARVRRCGGLPAEQVLEIGAQVADALAAAETRGLTHRDLKPANLMLVRGEAVNVKVIDFGLAKAAATETPDGLELTRTQDFVGTPAFASPEHFNVWQEIDARSDFYALGATLWYALTGRTPIPGRTADEIRQRQQENILPLDHLRAAGVPRPLAGLLRTLLSPDPSGRPQTAAALMAALVECRRQVTPVGRSSPARRRTLVLAGLAGGLIAAAVVAGWIIHARSPNPATVAAPAAVTALAVPDKSVAVLSFENLSTDPDNAFFADGVQDEVLTDLAKIADLKVISRTSVLPYKKETSRNLREIGQALGVAYVVEGSVQRAGNQIRVTAQLIDARTDTHRWAEHYDRPLDDVFTIQSEIARAIAGQLQAKLSPQEKSAIDAPPTGDLQAYDLYLQARDLYERNAMVLQSMDHGAEAIPLLEQALARDQNFLPAWCLLARVHGSLYRNKDHTPARLEQFSAAVQGAVRLAPDAGETHLALANYHYQRRDYAQAATELALARRTLPNDSLIPELTGYLLRRQGQWEESARNLERALTLDPRNFVTLQQLGSSYLEMHRYADAERTFQRALAIKPGDPYTRVLLADVPLEARADVRPYASTLAAVLAEDPALAPELDDPDDALCERSPAAYARALAHLPPEGTIKPGGVVLPRAYYEGVFARAEGDTARARAAFTAARAELAKIVAARPDAAVALSFLGVIDAGLGRKEDALAEGRRAGELLPVAKDAVVGPDVAVRLARIYAWTGEKSAAVETLAALERVPNNLPYGALKLDPQWDDLRGDAGFEALLASLAPKPAP